MRDGAIVEECAAGQLANASHPYTQGLLAAIPRIDETRDCCPSSTAGMGDMSAIAIANLDVS